MLLGQLIDSQGIANAVRQGKEDSINNPQRMGALLTNSYNTIKQNGENLQVQDAIKSATNPETGETDQKLVLANLAKVNPALAYKQAEQFKDMNAKRDMASADLAYKQATTSKLNTQAQQEQSEQKLKGFETLQKMIVGVNDQIGYDRVLQYGKSLGLDVSGFPSEYDEKMKPIAFNAVTKMGDQLKYETAQNKMASQENIAGMNNQGKIQVAGMNNKSREGISTDKNANNIDVANINAGSRENVANINGSNRVQVAGMKNTATGNTLAERKYADKQAKEQEKELGTIEAADKSLNTVKSQFGSIFKNGEFTKNYAEAAESAPGVMTNLKSLVPGSKQEQFIKAVQGLSNTLETMGFSDIKKIGSVGSVSNAEWQKMASQYGIGKPEDLLKLPVNERMRAFTLLEKTLADSSLDNQNKKEKLKTPGINSQARTPGINPQVGSEDRYQQWLKMQGK